jgi:hypothetical protein
MSKLSLDELATQIKDCHAGVLSGYRTSIEHAIEAGKLLIIVKLNLPHGAYEHWVENKAEISVPTAQLYKRLAEGVEAKPEMLANILTLGLAEADHALRIATGQKTRRRASNTPAKSSAKPITDDAFEAEDRSDDYIARDSTGNVVAYGMICADQSIRVYDLDDQLLLTLERQQ